jgi:hypothetical protein
MAEETLISWCDSAKALNLREVTSHPGSGAETVTQASDELNDS